MLYRHEWKHPVSPGDVMALRARLGAVLQRDAHTVDGRYQIRSLYFDNLWDKALREKLDGVEPREKYRLRCYNGGFSYVLLEKKEKRCDLCRKTQEALTVPQTQALLAGAPLEGGGPLYQELARKMTLYGLRPKTVVEYTREPFVYGPGNVRVTLDYGLRTGLSSTEFLRPDCPTIPVWDTPVILEVKWDEYLPDFIRGLVQVPGTRRTAFSKYAACRVYD